MGCKLHICWPITRNDTFVLFKIYPNNFACQHVRALSEFSFDVKIAALFCPRFNIAEIAFLVNFRNDHPWLREFIVQTVLVFSFRFLVCTYGVCALFRYTHLYVTGVVSVVVRTVAAANRIWNNFTDSYASKIFLELFPRHIKWTILRILEVVKLSSEGVGPAVTIEWPLTSPLFVSPWIP